MRLRSFAQAVKILADLPGRIAQHGVLDLADRVGSIVPGLVHEVRVGGNGIDLYAHFLQFFVMVGDVAQLSRTHKGEVGGVEEEHGPLAQHVFFGDFNELAVFEGLGFERFDRGVKHGHVVSCLVNECDGLKSSGNCLINQID